MLQSRGVHVEHSVEDLAFFNFNATSTVRNETPSEDFNFTSNVPRAPMHKESHDQPKQSQSFVIGQPVERRDRDEEWQIGWVTSAHPLRVTYGGSHESTDEGYEWDEVRALSKAETIDVMEKEIQSKKLTHQLWAQAIHNCWCIGAFAVILLGACWHKITFEHQDQLEKRVTSVLCPREVGQEPQKYSRRKQEAGEPEDHLLGLRLHHQALPEVVKNQLEATVKGVGEDVMRQTR